jgi:hypothetical protein
MYIERKAYAEEERIAEEGPYLGTLTGSGEARRSLHMS